MDQMMHYQSVRDGLVPEAPTGHFIDNYTLKDVYKRLGSYFKPYMGRTIIALLITLPIGALDGAIAYSLKPFVDGMQGKDSIIDVSFVPMLIVGFTLVQGLLNYISTYMNGWLGAKVMIGIQQDLFRKLHVLDTRYFDRITSGEVLQRFFRDPEQIHSNILENTKKMLTRVVSSVVLIGVMLSISWKLALIAVVMLGMALLPTLKIKDIIHKISEDTTSALAALMSFYTDTVGGFRVISGYNLQPTRNKQYDKLQEQMFTRRIKRVQAQGWLTPSMHLMASMGIGLIIWVGSSMVVSGEITQGGFVSFLGSMLLLYNPIKGLGPSIMSSHLSLLAARRIFILLDKKLVIMDQPGAKPLKAVNKGIRFENVSFFYDYRQMDKKVLKNINLEFKKGELTALVGPSGGGKTTLVNLIPRFYEVVEGAIYIDDQDIRHLTLESLRNHIATVFQENYFFNGTFRDNLLVGKPKATDEELWQALAKAHLDDFIRSQPEGLDTEIGERGVLMSGGQRQRLAIARAILRDAPIVILDEATSALDNETEALVYKAIESLIENRTVIVIAHRLSTIRNADRIYVVENGEVTEGGTHKELLEKAGGMYARLYNAQFDSKQFQFEDIAKLNAMNVSLNGSDDEEVTSYA